MGYLGNLPLSSSLHDYETPTKYFMIALYSAATVHAFQNARLNSFIYLTLYSFMTIKVTVPWSQMQREGWRTFMEAGKACVTGCLLQRDSIPVMESARQTGRNLQQDLRAA